MANFFGKCAYYSILLSINQSTSFSWNNKWRALRAGIPGCSTTYTNSNMCNATTTVNYRSAVDGISGPIYISVPDTVDKQLGLSNKFHAVYNSIGSKGTTSSYRQQYLKLLGGSIYKIYGTGGGLSQEVSFATYPTEKFLTFIGQFNFASNCTYNFTWTYVPSTGYLLDRYSQAVAWSQSNGQYGVYSWSQELKSIDIAINDPLIATYGSTDYAWGNNIRECQGLCI